jgi:hypothetical protein
MRVENPIWKELIAMLTRRAPTKLLVCTFALWVIAGFLPGQISHAAATGPAYQQEESLSNGATTVATDRPVLSVAGDPDDMMGNGNNPPKPGDGDRGNQPGTIVNVLLEMIAVWMSLILGFPQ